MRHLNYAMIARTLCLLMLFEAFFMIVPLIVAIINNEVGAARAFGISTAVTLAVALGGWRFIRPVRKEMNRYDNLLLTALVWVVFSFFGLIPYMLAPTTSLGFSAAFFEAMSGFTTTGASLIESTDQLSHAIHIWRSLSQWIGGLGIIIFTLALVPMLNSSGGMQMFNAEQNKIAQDKVSPRISSTARLLWGVYIILTLILFGLLCIGPMSIFEAACHALSTMSTGGFSTSSDGVNAFPTVYVKVIITVFMFIGGVNFVLVYRAASGHIKPLMINEAFKAYCKTILLVTLLFIGGIVMSGAYRGWQSVTIDPLFQVVSFITSTGFMLRDFNSWGPAVMLLSLLLIFIGGCAGSTSGGAKIDRVVYLLKFLHNEVKRVMRPNAVLPVRVNKRVIPAAQVNKVVAFLALYVLITLAGTFLLSITELPVEQAFVSSLAAMGNDSLSVNDSSIGCDYMALSPVGHYILSSLMLIGRLEIMTVLVLLSPAFWRR